MANYTSSLDLKNDVLFRAGELTDGTSDFDAQALQYLNRAWQIIWEGGHELDPETREDWIWLMKTGYLTLQPFITANVNLTSNNATITFTTAPVDQFNNAISVQNWWIRISGWQDVFKITAHISGQTTATLDSVYTGPTQNGAQYTAFLLEYTLATDMLRLMTPM